MWYLEKHKTNTVIRFSEPNTVLFGLSLGRSLNGWFCLCTFKSLQPLHALCTQNLFLFCGRGLFFSSSLGNPSGEAPPSETPTQPTLSVSLFNHCPAATRVAPLCHASEHIAAALPSSRDASQTREQVTTETSLSRNAGKTKALVEQNNGNMIIRKLKEEFPRVKNIYHWQWDWEKVSEFEKICRTTYFINTIF